MKRTEIFSLFILLFSFLSLTACGQTSTLTASGNGTPSSGGPGMDYTKLVTALRAAGATAVAGGNVSQPFLSVQGHIITIDGEPVQVYEYASSDEVKAAATHISADGSTFTTPGGSTAIVDWVMPPHLYKDGRLIVIYIGTNSNVMQLLTRILGKQFAGS